MHNKIFIIEDDPIATFLVKKIVQNSGAFNEICTFSNGQLALDQLIFDFEHTNPLPDLILLDINMPILDGWEFLDAVIKINKPREIPVILLTSSIDLDDIERSRQYSKVKGYFVKPLSNTNFAQILQLAHINQ